MSELIGYLSEVEQLNGTLSDPGQLVGNLSLPVAIGGGLTEEVKQALLDLFQHLAYTDADGQDYYDALYNAFYPPAELVRITAVYTQTSTVFPDTPLDDLKDDLVVTAHYSDGTSEAVTTYTLSGTLTAGTSTVTVTYEDKTTTFNVTVSAPAVLSSISAVYTQSGVVYPTDSLDSLKPDLVVTAHYSDSSTAPVTTYALSGTLTVGTSTITVTYSDKTTTFNVTVTAVPVLDSITATYTQSGTVYDTDSLDSLKADLVVTAVYTDSSTEVVPSTDYTLSGTLTVGTSTITVSYEGKTTTFNVTVTEQGLVPTGYTQYDYVKYTGVNRSSTTTAKQSIIATKTFSDLNVLKLEFDISPHTAKTSAAGILGGHAATTGNDYTISFYGRTDTKRVSAFSHGTALALEDIPNMQVGSIVHVVLDPGSASPSTLITDKLSTTGAWTSSRTIYAALGYCGQWMPTNSTLVSFASIGILKIYDQSNTLVGQYVPCVRDADNVIGIWDTETEEFYTSATVGYATIGGDSCEWAVGNWEV